MFGINSKVSIIIYLFNCEQKNWKRYWLTEISDVCTCFQFIELVLDWWIYHTGKSCYETYYDSPYPRFGSAIRGLSSVIHRIL